MLRVNLILLSQVVEMLVAQGFSQWEATEVELMQYAPSSSRLPLSYSTDNSMTKAKEDSKEMCYPLT